MARVGSAKPSNDSEQENESSKAFEIERRDQKWLFILVCLIGMILHQSREIWKIQGIVSSLEKESLELFRSCKISSSRDYAIPEHPVRDSPNSPNNISIDIRKEYTYEDFPIFNVTPIHQVIVDEDVQEWINQHPITIEDYPDKQILIEKYGELLNLESLEQYDREIAVIKWVSDSIGFGLFAKRRITMGELIGRYTGILGLGYMSNKDYTWSYGEVEDEIGYKLEIGVDAKDNGNYVRFVNHKGADANCDVELVPLNGKWDFIYIAKREILPGEELTVDYGDEYFETRK
jgi:hypothetical protein